MAVAVKYVMPFSAVDNTLYKVEIYSEYEGSSVPSGWPIELQAGETPIIISEDSSDDIFAPMRTSTGSISVCTKMPNGGVLDLEDLHPANNISRHVVLSRHDGTSWVVEWRGFLSCELYNQEYNGIPKVIDLPIISVLEAMDSVRFKDGFIGIRNIRTAIYMAIHYTNVDSGVYPLFDNLLFGSSARKILSKKIDTLSLYEKKEETNMYSVSYFPLGKSCKEVLSDICAVVGWCARESNGKLYLLSSVDEQMVDKCVLNDLVNIRITERGVDINDNTDALFESNLESESIDIKDMLTDYEWRGTGHQQSITSGAEVVQVSADLEDYDIKCVAPDRMPDEQYSINRSPFSFIYERGNEEEESKYCDGFYSTLFDFNNSHDFKVLYLDEGQYERPEVSEYTGTDKLYRVFMDSRMGRVIDFYNPNLRYYAGAFTVGFSNEEEDYESTGLYISAALYGYESVIRQGEYYAVKTDSILPLNVYNGLLRVKFDGFLINEYVTGGDLFLDPFNSREEKKDGSIKAGDKIRIAIQWGNKYFAPPASLSGKWSLVNSFTVFEVEKLDDGFEIPIPEYNKGELVLYVMPFSMTHTEDNGNTRSRHDYIIKSLSVEYEPKPLLWSNHQSNSYVKHTNSKFKDEKTIAVKYASMLGNVISPSHIFDNTHYVCRTIDYRTHSGSYRSYRPESYLLGLMASYYCNKRRVLTLEIKHINSVLPMNIIMGENQIGYKPVSYDINYKTKVCKLTCLEVPH